MNTAEGIQAAIKKLTKLKADSTPGVWTILDGGDRFIAEEDPLGDGPFEYIVSEPVEFRREADCDLIEVLHRTIDAQLLILRAGRADETEPFTESGRAYESLADILARAINGATS